MSAEHMLFLVVLFFIMLFIIATGYAYYSYKKHIQDYTFFLQEYRRNGLYVDSISNVSENFGVAFYYLKIMFFIRLLKNKKMYVEKGKPVERRCYDYMKSLPEEQIAWMRSWRVNFFVQAVLFVTSVALVYIHSVIYNY